MSYLENILVCIGVPFLLALLFVKGKQKEYLGFILCGMCCCLLAAYVTSFFMAIYVLTHWLHRWRLRQFVKKF